MKTVSELVAEIRGQLNGTDEKESFDITIEDGRTTTTIIGRVERNIREETGTEHQGFYEKVNVLVSESIEIFEIYSYTVYGIEIPPLYSTHEIKEKFDTIWN